MHIHSDFVFPRTGIRMKNRVALAPLTNKQSNADGTLHENERKWLERRAQGGFGMITTCAAHVSLPGQGWPGELGIFSDALLPGLTHLAQSLNQHECLSIVQIYHGGVRSPSNLTGVRPVSASTFELDVPNFETPREASRKDIQSFIQDFKSAAVRAEKAGFHGVEIHGAHGYLITQFLSTQTNLRTDEWGGSLENRYRLLKEIVQAIRGSVSKKFIVGVRISPENLGAEKGLDFDEMLKVAQWLSEEELDFLHVSVWNSFKEPEKYKGSGKTVIEHYREAVPRKLPLMVAGAINTPEEAHKVLELGADLVSLGRVAIGNPDWPLLSMDPHYVPAMPPFSARELEEKQLSSGFVEYMRRWPNFVK